MATKKKQVKIFREIASRLPRVYEQSISGWYPGVNKEGKKQMMPHIQNIEINHVRRMKRAFKRCGMDGVKDYLDMIHKLQIKRREQLQKDMQPVVNNIEAKHGSQLDKAIIEASGDLINEDPAMKLSVSATDGEVAVKDVTNE
jgi:hypothetical protein